MAKFVEIAVQDNGGRLVRCVLLDGRADNRHGQHHGEWINTQHNCCVDGAQAIILHS